ncbi:unnamed protein product [Thlaspi arvense]|uniref:KIB1-4 beta-propeller domain-containing protein n=1 Tax=Thlaspi arvense TaxID=13288 RepID=A0AAU9SCB0_THLAR|nr:unnamed protein product [Thlaspi arvense]
MMDQIEREEKMKSRDLDWSEICSDALRLILESLSSQISTEQEQSARPGTPSRNRAPRDRETDLGAEFPGSRCVASHGSWLLMLSPRLDFSVVNAFTGERIDLPPLSLRGEVVRLRRKDDGDFLLEHSWMDRETIINRERYINTAVLWVDETTRDYVPREYVWKTRVAITSSGDVLIIVSLKAFPENQEKRLFYIFKMDLEGEEWERVDSLGDHILVFGDGHILAAARGKEEDVGGGGGIIKSDSIYFVGDDVWPRQKEKAFQCSIGAFDLATNSISWFHSPYYLFNTRLLAPGSDKK